MEEICSPPSTIVATMHAQMGFAVCIIYFNSCIQPRGDGDLWLVVTDVSCGKLLLMEI